MGQRSIGDTKTQTYWKSTAIFSVSSHLSLFAFWKPLASQPGSKRCRSDVGSTCVGRFFSRKQSACDLGTLSKSGSSVVYNELSYFGSATDPDVSHLLYSDGELTWSFPDRHQQAPFFFGWLDLQVLPAVYWVKLDSAIRWFIPDLRWERVQCFFAVFFFCCFVLLINPGRMWCYQAKNTISPSVSFLHHNTEQMSPLLFSSLALLQSTTVFLLITIFVLRFQLGLKGAQPSHGSVPGEANKFWSVAMSPELVCSAGGGAVETELTRPL